MRCTGCGHRLQESAPVEVDSLGYFRRYHNEDCRKVGGLMSDIMAHYRTDLEILAGKREPLIVKIPSTVEKVFAQVQEEKRGQLFVDVSDPKEHLTREEFFAKYEPL